MRVILFIFFILFKFQNSHSQSITYLEGEFYVKVKKNNLDLVKKFKDKNGRTQIQIDGLNEFLKKKKSHVANGFNPNRKDNVGISRLYSIKIDGREDEDKVIEALKNSGKFEYIEKRRQLEIVFTPNDTMYALQPYLDKIKAPQAWDYNPGGSNVVVAVLDNAIQTNHIDLAANMLPGYDVADNDNDPTLPPGTLWSHGTLVAGIAGAVNNNVTGVSSVANNKVRILPVKCTRNIDSPGTVNYGFAGIIWAVDNGAQIINASWGAQEYFQAEQDIINYAYQNNVIVVAAAGNSNNTILFYPASYDHVVAVSNLLVSDVKAATSQFNEYIDISAPGTSIRTTNVIDKFNGTSGTSMSSPVIAASLAYIKSCYPSLGYDDLVGLMKNTADDIYGLNPNFVGKLGAGRVNLLNALACKNEGLDALKVSLHPLGMLCSGDSSKYSVSNISGASYKWYKDYSIAVDSSSNQFWAKSTGAYSVQITKGQCSRRIYGPSLFVNSIKTPTPSTADKNLMYCFGADAVSATNINCVEKAVFEYQTSNSIIGYDKGKTTSSHPKIDVADATGKIDSLQVTIVWEKKNSGNQTTCYGADLGGSPQYDEVQFRLRSPNGKLFDLISEGTFGTGASNLGTITTVFKSSGANIIAGTLPSSGSFLPEDSFSEFVGEFPLGTWELVAWDTFLNNPLCISSFGLKFYTNSKNPNSQTSWWNAETGGSIISSSPTYTFTNLPLGQNVFYAQNRCSFQCPSFRRKTIVNVQNPPLILAFPKSKILLTQTQLNEVSAAQTINYSVNASGFYTVSGLNMSGNSYTYLIANEAPQNTVVSLCSSTNYVFFAQSCSGNITWQYNSNQVTNKGVWENVLVPGTQLSAQCNQSFSCGAIGPSILGAFSNTTAMSLSHDINNGTQQTFFGSSLSSTQKIFPNSQILYKGSQSVDLQPGFFAAQGNVFKAEIATCP
ncbi:MAG: S8 family peptidase [Leadbetterella sp.]